MQEEVMLLMSFDPLQVDLVEVVDDLVSHRFNGSRIVLIWSLPLVEMMEVLPFMI